MPSAALERHPATSCSALRGIKVSITREPESVRGGVRARGRHRSRCASRRRGRRASPSGSGSTPAARSSSRADGRESGYREFNFSPSGEWAAYGFQRYREGALLAEVSVEIVVRRGAQRLELAANTIPVNENGKLRIGLSAVIEDESGALSYWALRHAPGKPDFHHPDAFALELDEIRH